MDLKSPIEKAFRLSEFQAKALKKMGILSLEDLVYHFPTRYGDTHEVKQIENLEKGLEAVLFGKVTHLKTSKAFRKKIPMAEGTLEDETGKMKLIWFNQPYIAKMIHEGSLVRVEGKVTARKEELYISNPKIERVTNIPTGVGDSLFGKEGTKEDSTHSLYPVYPESKGVTSNWIFHAIQKIISAGSLENLVDPIPEEILKRYNLPGIRTAFIWIHAPKNEKDSLSARKRFAFEEIFFIQLEKHRERKTWREKSAFKIDVKQENLNMFLERFPFKATDSQTKAIESILNDFKKGFPMSRLLEGDVGSGKTFVAAATVYAVSGTRPNGKDYGNLQTAYMVPTEILAKQQYENFIKYF
jgi:ATP-dependent DNA helicase RecG